MPENNITTQTAWNRLDLTGQRFGLLTVTSYLGKVKGKVRWNCVCDCGKSHTASTEKLRAGLRTCGCQKGGYRHGMHKTRIYSTWRSMLQRCRNPKDENYRNYGGRGIQVCERWHIFENFYADMGNPPTRFSIERINNNGNYEPSNCKWIPLAKQHRNKRTNRFITMNGVTLTIADWADETGISQKTISERLRRGWSEQLAVSIPTMHKFSHSK